MKRRTVSACLVGVALLNPGCWAKLKAERNLRIRGKRVFRERELYLEETEPERLAQMRLQRNAGICLEVLGVVGFCYGLALVVGSASPFHGGPEPEKADSGGAVILGSGIVYLIGCGMAGQYKPYVRKARWRRNGQLLVAPNGCLLTYRF